MEKQVLENKKSVETKKSINSPKGDILSLKKDVINSNPILNNLDNYEKSSLFKKIGLKNKEILFDEGSLDNNLYIVKKGHLSVEKYTTKQRNKTKQLAILKKGDFLGEGSLKDPQAKQNKIVSIGNSEVLSINGKTGLRLYIEENPKEGLELLVHIINVSNSRLLESNSQITANYEINMAISDLTDINLGSIFSLFDKFANIIGAEYVLYFENHETIDDIVIWRYDSRIPGKMQDKVLKKDKGRLNIRKIYKDINIDLKDSLIVNELKIGNMLLGYIVIGRVRSIFSVNEKKMISGISNSLTGILKQYIINKEKIYKDYGDIYMEEV